MEEFKGESRKSALFDLESVYNSIAYDSMLKEIRKENLGVEQQCAKKRTEYINSSEV